MQNQITLVDVEPVSKDNVEQIILPKDDLDSAHVELLYRTKEAYCFTLELNGSRRHLIIPCGFEFDSASIPSIFWWLYSPTSQAFLTAGLIHDFLYRNLKESVGLTRKEADIVFKLILQDFYKTGFNHYVMPNIAYFGLRWIAGKYYKINSDLKLQIN